MFFLGEIDPIQLEDRLHEARRTFNLGRWDNLAGHISYGIDDRPGRFFRYEMSYPIQHSEFRVQCVRRAPTDIH